MEYCKQCGKPITDSQMTEHYHGGYVCKTCAVVDAYGNICPECGKKVPHEHMNGNYCDKCAPDVD